MLFAYGFIYFPFSTINLGHTWLCATHILRCPRVRSAVVPTSPIDPTARGSSNYGGRGDPELWGMETHTDYELRYVEPCGAETPGFVA